MTEELLLPVFFRLKGNDLQDYRIELVNVGGTSFYPFIHLFNSTDAQKRIDKKIAILTDGDQFTKSKDSKYSFANLLNDDYLELNNLYSEISTAAPNSRIPNLNSAKNNNAHILIQNSFKTFEYEVAFNNISHYKSKIEESLFVQFIKSNEGDKFEEIAKYYKDFDEDFTKEQHAKVSLLFWKTITGKVDFAQDFSLVLLKDINKSKYSFVIPPYINEAFRHLTTSSSL
jgi:putative ATP-dependent endonuclease of OLD family